MKNRIATTLFTIGAALAVTAALAGAKTRDQVVIDDTAHMAYGDLGTVRATRDNVQFIGCYTQSSDFSEWAWCQASDSTGAYRGCYVDNPRHLATIRSMNGDSRFLFQWDPNTGYCTSINVDNESYFEPKT